MMDELQAPNAFDTEWTSRPIGHVWPWIGVATGALAIAVGAVFFSPTAEAPVTAPAPAWAVAR